VRVRPVPAQRCQQGGGGHSRHLCTLPVPGHTLPACGMVRDELYSILPDVMLWYALQCIAPNTAVLDADGLQPGLGSSSTMHVRRL
jgi:hypothetical protein